MVQAEVPTSVGSSSTSRRRVLSTFSRSRPRNRRVNKKPPREAAFFLSVEKLCDAKYWPAFAAIGHEANAQEAEGFIIAQVEGSGTPGVIKPAETLSTSNAFPLLVNVTDVSRRQFGKLNVSVCFKIALSSRWGIADRCWRQSPRGRY